MPITITIHGENAGHALMELRDFAVGLQGRPAAIDIAEAQNFSQERAVAETAPSTVASEVKNDNGQQTTARERGKPAPGRARRTKEEIAEDEAADKADAATAAAATDAGIQADNAEDVKSAISTGDERVGPEDDAETVAQDEADEKAESSALFEERPADKKLTHDDVRQALGAYVKDFGMAAAQADGPKVIALALKNPAAAKISDIPDDQGALKAVIDGVMEMTAKNPFGHKKVAA